ncbi:MAG: metal ABC transporter permease [Brevinematia bacterium]
MDLISVLFDPSMPFIRNAFIASLLSSVLFGVIGSIVSVKKITGLAGAISHSVLGGIGLALFLSGNKIIPYFPPSLGAVIFAILTAITIAIISLKAKQREDTLINALWAIGMSLGIIFIAKTPEYVDPMSYLFGNILLVSKENLILLASLDIVVLLLVFMFYRQIEASIFDEEFARARGINTDLIFVVLLILTAVSVVLLQTFVGIVMVIAMLTLPAGTSVYFSKNLATMMILSSILSALFSFAGLFLSWQFNLPAGAMIVMVSGGVFLICSFLNFR